MPAPRISIISTGLVASVGLSAVAACAAIRAGVTNPTETRFMNSDGDFIMAHQVSLETPWRGRTKLVKMAAMAIAEALEPLGETARQSLPLLLCVAEQDRPGRLQGLDDLLSKELEMELDVRFHPKFSAVLPQGRIGVLLALAQAGKLIAEDRQSHVIIAATDSLLVGSTLAAYAEQDRLLTNRNSNGFMPGEGAGAILVTAADDGAAGLLVCLGLGFGVELAAIDSERPLRADGLTHAIKNALAAAGLMMAEIGYRICTMNGEQYWFKELDLATSRLLRGRHEFMDLWHPADCIGETGSASLPACMGLALIAARKGFSAGSPVLVTASNDNGERAAVVLKSVGAA